MKTISKKVGILSLLVSLLLGIFLLPVDYKTSYGVGYGVSSSLFLWGGFLIVYGNYLSKGKWYWYIVGGIMMLSFFSKIAP